MCMKCPLIFQFHKGAIETRQGSVLGVFDPCFNPRAHVERDLIFVPLASLHMFQSTRPRGARRIANICDIFDTFVSIHAPTWSATSLLTHIVGDGQFQSTRPRGARQSDEKHGKKRESVSIHAPTWSATRELYHQVLENGFQSTRPRGARRSARAERLRNAVSIHAPTWSATPDTRGTAQALKFQSTRPRGARRSSWNASRRY